MRAKHVQTMQELFVISPEEEEEMHRKWEAARGMPSTWTPPSELDKKTHKPPVSQPKVFSVGDAVWCKGHAAVICVLHETGDKRTYDVAYSTPGGEVRLLKHVFSLRSRFRPGNNVEAEWLNAASDLMSEESWSKDKAKEASPPGGEDSHRMAGDDKGPAPHGGQDSPSGQKRGNDDAANFGANKRKRASQEDDQHMPGSEGGQTSDGARVEKRC